MLQINAEKVSTKYYEAFDLFMAVTLSWRRSASYRNQSIDLLGKSMDWFLYDRSLRHDGVKAVDRCLTKPNFELGMKFSQSK